MSAAISADEPEVETVADGDGAGATGVDDGDGDGDGGSAPSSQLPAILSDRAGGGVSFRSVYRDSTREQGLTLDSRCSPAQHRSTRPSRQAS